MNRPAPGVYSPDQVLLRGQRESAAIRLLLDGSSPRHVVETTGVPMERLRELVAEQPRSLYAITRRNTP